ncbi:pickpocket protein 28-like [Ostrinia furnacalis]|uniref:pickpocket protein 28-like n=1 Tax=Ostrinia furnacalis TaxID=93504 RepID=UPI00103CFE2D|nr:pickpocket protein 28-like [Ostrinia furnacalis]
MDRLLNVSMEVDDIFYVCKLGKNDCTDLVKRVLTEDGICFNINGLAASDILNYNTIQREYKYSYNEHEARNWTFTEGYTNDDVNAYPYRGQESGETPYLSLNLADLEPIKDKNCNVVYTGYKIYLHHPADWPQAQSYYFAALPEQVSSMAVEFSAVSTSKDLQAVALKVRQCYFPEERPLKYFKIYSYNHCRQECLTNFTYARCGCVMTYMPFHTHDKICSSESQIYCFIRANDVFSTEGSEQLQDCRCLPACNYIQYDADIHKTEFNYAEFHIIKLKKYYKKALGHDVDLKRVFKTITHDLKTEKLEDPPNIFHVEKLHDDITDLPLHLK